ncbi:MAG: helix-turn-helix transcriptional regulator [Solirubrobacteraceae bacterium]
MPTTLMHLAREWATLAARLPSPLERRFLREHAELSLDAMAQKLDVSQSAVYRWEAGTRTPQGAALARYVELLERLARPFNDEDPTTSEAPAGNQGFAKTDVTASGHEL